MRLRLLLVLTLALLVTLAVAGPALAQGVDVTSDEGIVELDEARALIDRSVELYENGDVEEAYTAARNAYLDHFEFVEIPLRVRDEALTLTLEEDFANLRNQIEAGIAVDVVEDTAAEVKRGLDDVERVLAEPGLAAPILAAGYSFMIMFREGLEAVLIVAAILGYLEASRNGRYKGAVIKGVGLAGVATVLTFVVAAVLINIAPVQRELLEAATAVLAVVMLFYVSFWLITRLEHRRWMEFVKAKVWTAASTGSTLALAGVGFTAVYREGFETVLFYQALLSFARGLTQWVVLGAVLGLAVLVGVGFSIFRAGRKVPIKLFLGTAVVLIMVLSVAFAGNAVRSLQQSATIPVTFLEGVPRLPIFLAELTGWHPTAQTLLTQAVLALIYIAGAIWIFVILPRREKRVLPFQTATAAEDVPEVQPASAGES